MTVTGNASKIDPQPKPMHVFSAGFSFSYRSTRTKLKRNRNGFCRAALQQRYESEAAPNAPPAERRPHPCCRCACAATAPLLAAPAQRGAACPVRCAPPGRVTGGVVRRTVSEGRGRAVPEPSSGLASRRPRSVPMSSQTVAPRAGPVTGLYPALPAEERSGSRGMALPRLPAVLASSSAGP